MKIVSFSYHNDEFLNGALRHEQLQAWAKGKGLMLPPASARIAGADAVGVQTYLAAIAEHATVRMDDREALWSATDILEANPEHPCHPRDRTAVLVENDCQAARRILEGKVWAHWRDTIRQALDAGELQLFDSTSLAPIAWTATAPKKQWCDLSKKEKKQAAQAALARHLGNKSHAARELQIDPETLKYHLPEATGRTKPAPGRNMFTDLERRTHRIGK